MASNYPPIRPRWYTDTRRYKQRDLPVTPVRPGKGGEEVEGQALLDDVVSAFTYVQSRCEATWGWTDSQSRVGRPVDIQKKIPNLSETSISIIIHPTVSLGILKGLYPSPPASEEPHSVWFQPGADDESIWAYVKARGLEGKVVGQGKCVLRDGDAVRAELKSRL